MNTNHPTAPDADFDWPLNIRAVLDSTAFMSLATAGPEGPWSNPLHFAFDSELNLYFLSQPGSRHMHYLKANSAVAVSIYSTQQPPVGDVAGLQIRATAQLVEDSEVPYVHKVYYGRPEFSSVVVEPSAYQGPDAPWKFVRVTPTEICLFDSRNFGQQRQVVPAGVRLP